MFRRSGYRFADKNMRQLQRSAADSRPYITVFACEICDPGATRPLPGYRLHIAEFPKHSVPFRGVVLSICRHEGGPMTGIRVAATAIAMTLAAGALAQTPP